VNESVTLVAAFGGGLVSFLSPCVLPIVPAYLSVITGLEVGDIQEGRGHLAGIARDTGLFIAGFSAVFVLLGLSATTIGQTLFDNQGLITRISGLVVLAMALFVLGSLVLEAPWLYQERRLHPDLSRFGPLAAPVAGVAFGFGWTPCIGPVLTSILAIAATQQGVGRGALLLAVYSAGLGVPFLATGLAFARLAGALGWVKRHFTGITIASAGSLAVFGVILALDRLVWVTSELQQAADTVGLGWLVDLG
jgi:cytochrome c-type biogenesis protein